MDKKKVQSITLQESINQNIHTLLTSNSSENRYDENFGNALWEFDFEVLSKSNIVHEQVKESLTKLIHLYEKRLEKVKIAISSEQEHSKLNNRHTVRERVDITIQATIVSNQKPFVHKEFFYISPLSY